MKELSIEGKATRYDQAIKVAKSKIKNDKDHVLYEDDVIEIFPELKESEDEGIRKTITEFFKNYSKNGTWKAIPDVTKWIAWLEKQGEQKPVDFSDLRTWKYIVDAVWTEKEGIGQYLDSPFTEEVAKKLQKRFGHIEQPKQEWSEEDESMWAEISDLLWEGYKQSGSKFSWDDIRNWVNPKLKSLRPQSHWKPTEEQIEALESATENCAYSEYQDCLQELIEQLKKLKE